MTEERNDWVIEIALICLFISISGYIRTSAALCIVTLVTDTVATFLTALGLRSNDYRTKFKFYRFAVYVMALARECFIKNAIISLHSLLLDYRRIIQE